MKTDSLAEAQAKEKSIAQLQDAVWEARLAGRDQDAAAHFMALKDIAESRSFSYRPASDIADLKLEDILRRVDVIAVAPGNDRAEVVDALLGAVDVPELRVSGLYLHYEQMTRDERAGKSADQIRRWKNQRTKAVANFQKVVGDLVVSDITRAHALTFRSWWQGRVDRGEVQAGTANKDFSMLGAMIARLNVLEGVDDEKNPFHRLRLKAQVRRRPSFSPAWIRDKLLAKGALDGLNDEARDAFLILINTGARPSEILALPPECIHLNSNLPYIDIQPNIDPDDPSEIKNTHSRRSVPLVGVSLEAMHRHPNGFPRYAAKPTSWSNLVMKFLRTNGLLETKYHKAYSLRHSFQDALQNADCPDRTRKELMGHAIDGVVYGAGARLDKKLEWLERISY